MTQRTSLRKTTEEWQDAFYSVDERNRQLQKKLNDQEQELKLLRVSQRRNGTHSLLANNSAVRAAPQTMKPQTLKRSTSAVSARRPTEKPSPQEPLSLNTTRNTNVYNGYNNNYNNDNNNNNNNERVGVKPNDDDGRNVCVSAVSAAPPDPMMVWGMENSLQHYATANALFHANEELRQRLDDAAALVKSHQHEVAAARAEIVALQRRLDHAVRDLQQVVRERDVQSAQARSAQQTVRDLESAVRQRDVHFTQERSALEREVAELRRRLHTGADHNTQLAGDVQQLIEQTRSDSAMLQQLRSQLSTAEAALASQRRSNEGLLVELRGAHAQLARERRRLLDITRQAQLAELRAGEAVECQEQLSAAQQARSQLEVRLEEELQFQHTALAAQAEEQQKTLREDVAEWRRNAAHWEEVAQLLYRDIAQRTNAHVSCREACEEAKRLRDETALALRQTTDELRLCRAKLDVVWPTHREDTRDLSPSEILATFGNYRATFKQKRTQKQLGKQNGLESWEQQHESLFGNTQTRATTGRKGDTIGGTVDDDNNDDDINNSVEFTVELCDAPLEEQLRELQEANAALVAELEQLRLTNELQTERLRMMEVHVRCERETVEASTAALEHREEAAQHILQSQIDRVAFLEAQVRSLRGYEVSPDLSLHELGDGETVFELFLGQILSTETPEGIELRNAFHPVFCSVDFLLHETVTTPIVTGLNAFLDTTVAFRVAMDALLQCYLQSRKLLIQLHRVRSQDEIHEMTFSTHQNHHHNHHYQNSDSSTDTDTVAIAAAERLYAERLCATLAEGSISLWGLVADEKCRNAQRPTLRGHIPLYTNNGHHIASVEFAVTVRTPFSESFRMLAAEAVKHSGEYLTNITDTSRRVSFAANTNPTTTTTATTTGNTGNIANATNNNMIHSFTTTTDMRTPSQVRMITETEKGRETSGTVVSTKASEIKGNSPPSMNILLGDGKIQLVPTPHHSEAFECVSTTSSSTSLLEPRHSERHSGFTLVPRTAAVASVSSSSSSTIRMLIVDVCKLHLPSDLTPVPRLSCYYTLVPLGRDVYLPAPPTPRYECEYLQEGGSGGTRFPIASVRELLAVTREPFMLFFFDESSSSFNKAAAAAAAASATNTNTTSNSISNSNNNNNMRQKKQTEGPYWALAMAEWRLALERPEEYVTLELSLMNQQGSPVRGAFVRVRLLATSKVQNAESGLAAALERSRRHSNNNNNNNNNNTSNIQEPKNQQQPKETNTTVNPTTPSPIGYSNRYTNSESNLPSATSLRFAPPLPFSPSSAIFGNRSAHDITTTTVTTIARSPQGGGGDNNSRRDGNEDSIEMEMLRRQFDH